MADSGIYDRWHKLDKETGSKVRSAAYGCASRWQARWRDESGPDGAVRQRKRNFAKRADAERHLAAVKADLARGTYLDPAAGKVKLRAYAAAWLTAQTFDPATREAVERRVRLWVYPTLGDYELRALRPSVVQAWLRGLQGRLAPSTVRVAFANLNAILGAAVDDKLIAANPCRARSVKAPPPARRKVEPWTTELVEALIAALPERYAAAAVLAAGLGLRQGECFGLAVDDIDFLGRVVHVRRQVKIIGRQQVYAPPKGGKPRDVPLPEWVALRLAAHLQAHPAVAVTLPWQPDGKPETVTARLLLARDGGAVHRSWFNLRVWVPALEAAGIEPAAAETGMHQCRHTYASLLLEQGCSIKVVAAYLGHADEAFTLRTYTHLMPSSEDRARQAIDAAFSGSGAPDVPQEGRQDA